MDPVEGSKTHSNAHGNEAYDDGGISNQGEKDRFRR